VFKGWFDLNYDKDVKYKDHYKQGWAKNFANEDIVKCVAKDVIVVNGENKEVERKAFDINTSKSFADWLNKLTTISTDKKYTPNDVIPSFLNSDKITGVDEVTRLNLEIKIYEHYCNKITDDKMIESYNTLLKEYGKTSAYKYKVRYYEDNIDGLIKDADNKSKITDEIKKLPHVYDNNDESMLLNNDKIQNSLLKKQSRAKEQIALYRTKQKQKDIKNIKFVNRTVLANRKGRV